jgi:hypothetical protein
MAFLSNGWTQATAHVRPGVASRAAADEGGAAGGRAVLCGEAGDDRPVGLDLVSWSRSGAVAGEVRPDRAGVLTVLEHGQLHGHNVDDR